VGGAEVRTDCGTVGGRRCQDGACVAIGACSPRDHEDACDGEDALSFCRGGVVERLRCADYGLAACRDGRCVP
jgi:hypothetical protein